MLYVHNSYYSWDSRRLVGKVFELFGVDSDDAIVGPSTVNLLLTCLLC